MLTHIDLFSGIGGFSLAAEWAGEQNKMTRKEYHQKYHLANREKINTRTRQHHFRYRYGITQEEAIKLVEKACSKCQICGSELSSTNKPHLDHDHKMGKIRGVLCRNCNSGLGLFGDNPNLLRIAARYLE